MSVIAGAIIGSAAAITLGLIPIIREIYHVANAANKFESYLDDLKKGDIKLGDKGLPPYPSGIMKYKLKGKDGHDDSTISVFEFVVSSNDVIDSATQALQNSNSSNRPTFNRSVNKEARSLVQIAHALQPRGIHVLLRAPQCPPKFLIYPGSTTLNCDPVCQGGEDPHD